MGTTMDKSWLEDLRRSFLSGWQRQRQLWPWRLRAASEVGGHRPSGPNDSLAATAGQHLPELPHSGRRLRKTTYDCDVLVISGTARA